MSAKTRMFNKRSYVFLKHIELKSDAKKYAIQYRNEGYEIRVIKMSKGYDIYYR
jgi:hypothetical protein